uniref:Fibroblast growth factor n=1 Tax=Trichuris muris TaxID=70415 RepID=A0A5S6QJ14_TRIMR
MVNFTNRKQWSALSSGLLVESAKLNNEKGCYGNSIFVRLSRNLTLEQQSLFPLFLCRAQLAVSLSLSKSAHSYTAATPPGGCRQGIEPKVNEQAAFHHRPLDEAAPSDLLPTFNPEVKRRPVRPLESPAAGCIVGVVGRLIVMCILAGGHMTAAITESSPTSLISSTFVRIPTATYAAIGGAAAPFGPPLFDSDDLNEDALLNTCMRHIRRNQPSFSLSSIRIFRDAPVLTGGQRSAPIHWVQYEKSNRLGKLYCRTGYHLLINNDGKVNGTHQDHNRFGVLEFLSVAFGLVSIKGKESNRYLCMNNRGRLYGSITHTTECIFMEKMLENYYNTYTSCRYSRRRRKWFVALNKRGRPRRGNRSRNKQKYAQFLVLHLDDEDVKGQQKKFFTNSPFGLDSFTQKWRSQKFQHSYHGGHWRQMKLKRGIDARHEFQHPLRSCTLLPPWQAGCSARENHIQQFGNIANNEQCLTEREKGDWKKNVVPAHLPVHGHLSARALSCTCTPVLVLSESKEVSRDLLIHGILHLATDNRYASADKYARLLFP